MEAKNHTNHTRVLKWALFSFRIVGGFSKKRSILSYVTMTSLFFVIVFMVIDLMLNFNGIESLRRITFLPSYFVSAIKVVFMIMNSKQLIVIIDNVSEFWRPDKFDEETEKEIMKFSSRISLICGSYTILGIFVCFIMVSMPLLDLGTKSLPYNDFAFCNIQLLHCWIPMYIWQILALCYQTAPAVLGFECLFISFVGYIMTGCTLLKIGLQKLNTDNLQKRRYLLKEVVKQHDFMMKFLNSLNDMYTIVMLLQFWCSFWSMILMLHMMVANGLPPKAEDVVYFGTIYMILFFQILIYSTGGALIEDRIGSVATDMYNVNWYGRNRTDLRKDLTLMIFRAQRTKVLNVGKISDLNYALFVATVKNSMSVFTLIFQLANQETKH